MNAQAAPAIALAKTVAEQVNALNWGCVAQDLDTRGYALLERIISADECQAVTALYVDDRVFRRHIIMEQRGYGRGEYKYFSYPLPNQIAGLRSTLYPYLAPIASGWNAAMGIAVRFPEQLAEFIARCHAAGQLKPTPLLLRYGPDDYNCLHQDLYGEHVFPLQVAILLSAPDKDFTGGEFVITEQRSRQQSLIEVVPLHQGDAVIFAVHHRPVPGSRGVRRAQLRHGVSRIRTGQRYTLGIIFHDAL